MARKKKPLTKYTAIYRDVPYTGVLRHLSSEYRTKQEFARDLRGNGYTPIRILSQKDIARCKSMPWHEKLSTGYYWEEWFEYVMQVF